MLAPVLGTKMMRANKRKQDGVRERMSHVDVTGKGASVREIAMPSRRPTCVSLKGVFARTSSLVGDQSNLTF